MCAGDLVENGALPASFGDGYPMDWPATATALLDRVPDGVTMVPGHGDHAGRAFVAASLTGFRSIARPGAQAHAGIAALKDAIPAGLVTADANREPIERAVAQLGGALNR